MFSSNLIKLSLVLHFFILLHSFQIPSSRLFIKNLPNSSLPLKSIKNLIEINEGIARVYILQEYLNDKNVSLETEYRFPINPDAVFDGFEARIDNKYLIGHIKEKKQAQQEYQENLQRGNTVAYSEIEKTAIDIMRVNIGNILPDQTIFIKYSYIESLELVLNKFRRFTLYGTLTPRYNPMDSGIPNLNINEIEPSINTYKWEIFVNLTSVRPFDTVYSPSHKISMRNFQENKQNSTLISLDPMESQDPDKDFVLIYKENEPFEPKILIERHPIYQNSSMAVLSFFPQLNSLSDIEALNFLSEKTESSPLKSDIEHSKGEFFFIIDRSGSMSGSRITNLKKALALFLASLPKDSFFNVISFGGNFEPLFKNYFNKLSSIEYNNKNLQIALDSIETFDADFGGTEIFYPLEAVLNTPNREGYPKLIFLLTDGDVMNSDSCVDHIKKNLGFSRIYTVGIGNGVSTSFIKRMAEYGRGNFEFVNDDDNLEEKTIHLLYSAISPYARNLKVIVHKEKYLKEMMPKIEKNTMIMKNEMFQFFMLLEDLENMMEKEDFKVKVSYENSFTGIMEEFAIDFSDMKILEKESDIFHKLGIKKKIKALTEDIKEKANAETEKVIIEESIKYQVLCEYTAFITVMSENTNANDFEKEKIVIDNIRSKDYEEIDEMVKMKPGPSYNNYNYNSASMSSPTYQSGGGGNSKFGGRMDFWILAAILMLLVLSLINF